MIVAIDEIDFRILVGTCGLSLREYGVVEATVRAVIGSVGPGSSTQGVIDDFHIDCIRGVSNIQGKGQVGIREGKRGARSIRQGPTCIARPIRVPGPACCRV